MSNTKIIFFDLETNGINKNCSVLSIAALKYSFDGKSLKQMDNPFVRYYFRKPPEKWDINAQKIHGLTDEIIDKKRGNNTYELFFFKDKDNFNKYCSEIKHFVGHNIAFDEQFIYLPIKYKFCTMKSNENIVKAKNQEGVIKWPTLKETALFYKIIFKASNLHDSYYDITLTYKIFEKMLNNEDSRKTVLDFLNQK